MNKTLFGCESGNKGNLLIAGFPFDHGSIGPYGTAKCPAILRQLSNPLGLKQGFIYNQKRRSKLEIKSKLSDIGDISFKSHISKNKYLTLIETIISAANTDNKKVIALGGDHLISLPIIRAHLKKYQEIQVVQIDAHSDFQNIESDDEPTHANFMSFLAQNINLKKVIQLGLRTSSRTIPSFPNEFVYSEINEIHHHLSPKIPTYLTIDLDGFDPYLAGAVSHPVHGGLTWDNFDRLIDTFIELNIKLIGADLCEYNPDFDSSNFITGHAVIRLLLKLLEAF